MNKNIDLTHRLIEKFGKKTNKIGRYSVSGIYAIFAGWTKPEDYFREQYNDFEGIKRMWSGVINHDFIESLLEKEKCEIKVVYKYKDIEIVGKCDYMPNEDEVIDFKTSDHILDKAKPWHLFQVQMYATMFNKKIGSIYQPILKDDKYILKFLGSVERNDFWYEKQCEKLYQFHEKLIEIQKNGNF